MTANAGNSRNASVNMFVALHADMLRTCRYMTLLLLLSVL